MPAPRFGAPFRLGSMKTAAVSQSRSRSGGASVGRSTSPSPGSTALSWAASRILASWSARFTRTKSGTSLSISTPRRDASRTAMSARSARPNRAGASPIVRRCGPIMCSSPCSKMGQRRSRQGRAAGAPRLSRLRDTRAPPGWGGDFARRRADPRFLRLGRGAQAEGKAGGATRAFALSRVVRRLSGGGCGQVCSRIRATWRCTNGDARSLLLWEKGRG